MATLEYVASGTSHMRILNNALMTRPHIVNKINEYFVDLNNKNNHKFSLLFNAFTEREFGKRFKDNYASAVHSIHADSGGLQIITQGKSITPKLKDQVYKTQAQYSDIAMCFDEIPIGVVGGRSDRNDISGRFFDRDNLEQFARETGKNIKRQIEIVLDEKSTAKTMIIAQGNDYETYMSWVDFIMKEIPPSYHEHIGGIAMGAAALGTGPLEDIERAAYATKLPFQMENPYIHILGVGSIRRLLPYIALAKSGYYPENIHISYDSTTHTSGASMGLYFLDTGMSITRTFNEDYAILYNDINVKYNLAGKGIDIHTFHGAINSNSTYYMNKATGEVDDEKMEIFFHCIIGYISSSIGNFTKKIDRCLNSKSYIVNVATEHNVFKEINSLTNMKDIDDFLYWMNTYGSSTKSKRISGIKPSTLDNFFGV